MAVPAAATTPGATDLVVSSGYGVVAAPGAAVTVAGTATGGAGATVSLLVQTSGGTSAIASTVVAVDDTWQIDTTMPVGDDGNQPVEVDVPGASGGDIGVWLPWFRQSDTTTTSIATPTSGHITSTTNGTITGTVVVNDPAFTPDLNNVSGVIVQGPVEVSPMQAMGYSPATGSTKAVSGFSFPVSSLSNGPATLIVSTYSSDLSTVKLAVLPLLIDLTTSPTVTAGQVTDTTDGPPSVDVHAVLADAGPDAVVTARLDGGSPTALSAVPSTSATRAWDAAWSVFDVPSPGTLGSQLIADGVHTVAVHVVSRGRTSDYTLPVTVDTTPSMTLDGLTVNFGPGVGNYTADLTGHVNGIHLSTGHWSAQTPAGMTLASAQTPVVSSVLGGITTTTWKSRIVVSNYTMYTRIGFQLDVTDLHGDAHCYWMILGADSVGGLAPCGATAPDAVTGSVSFAPTAVHLTLAPGSDNGSSVLHYVVSTTTGPDPASTSLGTYWVPGSVAMPITVPYPAAGSVEYIHVTAVNVMGSSPTADLGLAVRSSIVFTKRPSAIRDGALLPLQGHVYATASGVTGAPLPPSSLSLTCVSQGNFARTTTVFSPSATTTAFSTASHVRGTSKCSMTFLGDPVHGLGYVTSPTFLVTVTPGLSLRAAHRIARHGVKNTVTVTTSAIARDATVYLDRWVGTRWVHVASHKAWKAVSFNVTQKTRGTYKYRTWEGATRWHGAGSSSTVTIKVT